MNTEIYRALFSFNRHIDKAVSTLSALGESGRFNKNLIRNYSELILESKSAANTFIVGIVEDNEVREAAAWQKKRLKRERREQ
jgi:hypothetical protein